MEWLGLGDRTCVLGDRGPGGCVGLESGSNGTALFGGRCRAAPPVRHVLRGAARGDKNDVIRVGDMTIGGGPFDAGSPGRARSRRGPAPRGWPGRSKILPEHVPSRRMPTSPAGSPARFPGLGEEGLEAPGHGREATGLPVDHRGGRRGLRSNDREPRGDPDRREEHAELRAAQAGRPQPAAGPAQARHVGELEDLLLAAEYVLEGGNPTGRALRARASARSPRHSRYTLDLSIVPAAAADHASCRCSSIRATRREGGTAWRSPLAPAAMAAGPTG